MVVEQVVTQELPVIVRCFRNLSVRVLAADSVKSKSSRKIHKVFNRMYWKKRFRLTRIWALNTFHFRADLSYFTLCWSLFQFLCNFPVSNQEEGIYLKLTQELAGGCLQSCPPLQKIFFWSCELIIILHNHMFPKNTAYFSWYYWIMMQLKWTKWTGVFKLSSAKSLGLAITWWDSTRD